MQTRHPFLRRLAWNPFNVAVPFAYLAYTTYLLGFPVARTLGAAFVGLWFGLSVLDLSRAIGCLTGCTRMSKSRARA
jgi:hypothetical protein